MTNDVWVGVFTPNANRDAALALGNGTVGFSAYCTNIPPDGNGEWPGNGVPAVLWTFGAGLIPPASRNAFLNAEIADPVKYKCYPNVTSLAGMLAGHPQGPMFRYVPPEV